MEEILSKSRSDPSELFLMINDFVSSKYTKNCFGFGEKEFKIFSVYKISNLQKLIDDNFESACKFFTCSEMEILDDYDDNFPYGDHYINVSSAIKYLKEKIGKRGIKIENVNRVIDFKSLNCFFQKLIVDNVKGVEKREISKILGGLYEGGIDEKRYQKNGFGKIMYFNGDVYIGNFKLNQRSGYGFYIHREGKYTYLGEWNDNIPNGKGIIFSDNLIIKGVFCIEPGTKYLKKIENGEFILGEKKVVGNWYKSKPEIIGNSKEVEIFEEMKKYIHSIYGRFYFKFFEGNKNGTNMMIEDFHFFEHTQGLLLYIIRQKNVTKELFDKFKFLLKFQKEYKIEFISSSGGYMEMHTETLLQKAAQYESLDIFKYLLNHEKGIEMLNYWNNSCYEYFSINESTLYYCIKNSKMKKIELLLKHPKINTSIGYRHRERRKNQSFTPLDKAITNKKNGFEIVSMLVFYAKMYILDVDFDEAFKKYKRNNAYTLKSTSVPTLEKKIEELKDIIKNGGIWSVESHEYFPKRIREIAWSLFLFDERIKYIPNELKSCIISFFHHNFK